MKIHQITCIRCPLGCELEVYVEDNEVQEVKGNLCRRGIDYGSKEILNPMRMLTTTIPLEGGSIRMCPVKTSDDVPKGKLKECLQVLRDTTVKAPVHVGDVVLADIADTGADIVVTRTIE